MARHPEDASNYEEQAAEIQRAAPHIAKQYKTLYDAFVKAGFERDEALELVIAWIGRDSEEDKGF